MGIGIDALWEGLLEGRCALSPIRRFDPTGMPCQIAGQVPDEFSIRPPTGDFGSPQKLPTGERFVDVGIDAAGNVTAGQVVTCDASGNLAVTDPDRVIALVGVHDLVVVQAGDAILVVPRDRAQDVRLAVEALGRAGLDRYL